MIGNESRGLGIFKGFILLLIAVVMTAAGVDKHLLVTTSLGVICFIAAAGFFYFALKEGGASNSGKPPSRPDSNLTHYPESGRYTYRNRVGTPTGRRPRV
jgi:hypothetical protein